MASSLELPGKLTYLGVAAPGVRSGTRLWSCGLGGGWLGAQDGGRRRRWGERACCQLLLCSDQEFLGRPLTSAARALFSLQARSGGSHGQMAHQHFSGQSRGDLQMPDRKESKPDL